MSTNAPTPAGQRSRQMQTTTLEKTEPKRDYSHRHDQFDVLSDDLLAIWAYNERMACELARLLNTISNAPAWTINHVDVDERGLTDLHAAAIASSSLSIPQKWSLQQRNQRRAVALSRFIGILHGLSREYINELAQTSFLLDSYVVATWHRAMARISGAAIRWAQELGSEQSRDDLAHAFEQLEKGQEGTQVVLTNLKLQNGKMGIDVFTTRINPAHRQAIA